MQLSADDAEAAPEQRVSVPEDVSASPNASDSAAATDVLEKLLRRLGGLESAVREQHEALTAFMAAQAAPGGSVAGPPSTPSPPFASLAVTEATQTPDIQPTPKSLEKKESIGLLSTPGPTTAGAKADACTQTHQQQQQQENAAAELKPIRTRLPSSGPSGEHPRLTPKGCGPTPSPLSDRASLDSCPSTGRRMSTDARSPAAAMGSAAKKAAAEAAEGLRQRRAAFAALQASAPQQATRRASLAISAAQREMERAKARAKAQEEQEREEESGVLSWLMYLLMIALGIAALVGGMMAVSIKEKAAIAAAAAATT